MSPNSNEVHIYAFDGSKWQLEHTLTEVRTPLRLVILSGC